mmetsp:Transcript_9436/g.23242  ORF Transcript_9436/g.23242 Transcript_9436/m.23242 type:complete len:348 (-) Transcript_9436:215-1258(-)|eukprot:CAMPEP_0114496374 /NCGR_PEP_ID=MMETSP0109-20121206/5734_1 /TAXON_ID=29199 /ORGANISM="Chlorarachnion reptans, Strain CCCM449" /LENGTH=347 /DNA_ID=CAMNT_0001673639 /DNA_START=49 /DNA_END=1092 /DNA_ORIENTATION=-
MEAFEAATSLGRRDRYSIECRIGEGAFGEVFKAYDKKTARVVALKRVRIPNAEQGIPISLIREIKALEQIRSPHVITLYDSFAQGASVALVLEYMHIDLRQIIGGLSEQGRKLSDSQIKRLMIMILNGVGAIHKHNLIHRDVKPDNLLVNQNGVLKLADFGLARVHDKAKPYTHEVATRWYRAPELLFGSRTYGTGIDMWAVGCIFGEMMNHSPLFPGQNDIDQLSVIFSSLGTPNAKQWPSMKELPDYSKISFPDMKRKPLASLIPSASRAALDCIEHLLVYHPLSRATAAKALLQKYFFATPQAVHHSRLATLVLSTRQFTAKERHQRKPMFQLDAPFGLSEEFA